MDAVEKYGEFLRAAVLLCSISLFLIFFVNSKKEPRYKYFWMGSLFISFYMILDYLPVPFSVGHISTFLALSALSLFMFGAIRGEWNSLTKHPAKFTTFLFGIITFVFAFISFFAVSLVLVFLMESRELSQHTCFLVAFAVSGGVAGIFLSVNLWRLIRGRCEHAGSLFTPYWLWLQAAGFMFAVVSFVQLLARNLLGILSISIAATLFTIAGRIRRGGIL